MGYSPETMEAVDDWAAEWVIEAGLSSDSLGLYFKQAAQEPLLTVGEEITLARRIETGRIAKKMLAGENGLNPVERQEQELLVKNGQGAREHLAAANTALVVSIAKCYAGQGVPFPDLIQEGNVGLMTAVDKYDYTRGNRFATYATWWIRQGVTQALCKRNRIIQRTVYLEELGSGWGDFMLESEIPEPADEVERHLLAEGIEKVLSRLTPRQEQVLRLRFGLNGGKPLTQKEIGAIIGYSESGTRNLARKVLKRLRYSPDAEGLRDYL